MDFRTDDRRSSVPRQFGRLESPVRVLKGPDFFITASKGQRLTLPDWNLQLRQPILLVDGRMVVSVSRRRKVSCMKSRNSIRSASIGPKPSASCIEDGEIADVSSLSAFRNHSLAYGRNAR